MSSTQVHRKKFIYLIATAIALFLAVFPAGSCSAGTTVITNSVKATASSGGNTVSGGSGEVLTGKTEVDIFVETVVNGETVEYIDEHYEGSDIPEGGVYKETYYESEDGSVVVDTNIAVNADADNADSGDLQSTRSSADQENSEPATDISEDDSVNETASVINSIAKKEEKSENENKFEKKDELSDTSEEEQINNISVEDKPASPVKSSQSSDHGAGAESYGEAKPAVAKSSGEAKKETKSVGLFSFISNNIANLFKYVLSIFA